MSRKKPLHFKKKTLNPISPIDPKQPKEILDATVKEDLGAESLGSRAFPLEAFLSFRLLR